jgi:hypothetical protein
MFYVDLNVNEDVQGLNFGHVNWNQARMRVVDEHITAQCPCGVVVDAAGTVGHIAHDESVRARAKLRQDIRNGSSKQKETFWHLQGDLLGARGANAVDCFVDFKVIIGWKQGNGVVDGLVVEDMVGDIVEGTCVASTWGDYIVVSLAVQAGESLAP